MKLFVACVLALFVASSAFAPQPRMSLRSSRVETKMSMGGLSQLSTLLTALEEAKPDGYEYGAVNAPSFVLPLAAFGSVALAGIFFLLAPGEKALEQQRLDEAEKGAEFNSRKNKDLR